jgi:hypothetical protein
MSEPVLIDMDERGRVSLAACTRHATVRTAVRRVGSSAKTFGMMFPLRSHAAGTKDILRGQGV